METGPQRAMPPMKMVVLVGWYHFETGSQSITLGYRDGKRWFNTEAFAEAEPGWTVTHWSLLPELPELGLVPEPLL
jgi:hypothetical protein